MGPSGIGKKTFIKRLLSDQSLRSQFGIASDVVPRGPGFNGQSSPVTEANDLRTIRAGTILIKWQAAADSQLESLRDACPDDEHHMFYLYRPADEIHRELHSRSPESKETIESISAFARNTLDKCLNREKQGFRLTKIDASFGLYIRIT